MTNETNQQKTAKPTADGIAQAAKTAGKKGPPPVHLWNPEFCGDLDMRIARDGTWFYLGTPIGRMPLGVVPVEEDGSVYFEATVGRALYFQLLDERGMAVHSMRSVTYVHPGEQMTCLGCHEARQNAPPTSARPAAFGRPPSQIQPEVSSGAIPFNYEILVRRPVFDKKCVGCHQEYNKQYPPQFDPNDKSKNPRDLNAAKRAPDMSYESLRRYSLLFGMPGETQETVTETIEFAKELNASSTQFAVAIPHPGHHFETSRRMPRASKSCGHRSD